MTVRELRRMCVICLLETQKAHLLSAGSGFRVASSVLSRDGTVNNLT